MSFVIATGLIERSILMGTKRPQTELQRDPVLHETEFRAAWLVWGLSTKYGAIVCMLLLTGQRREDVGAMQWRELDLDGVKWTLPSERTKNRRPHYVPLSRQPEVLLAVRPRLKGREAFLVGGDGKGFQRLEYV